MVKDNDSELFNPDRYNKISYPLNLYKGIYSYSGDYISYSFLQSEDHLEKLLENIIEHFKNRHSNSYSRKYSLDYNLEKELVLLSHTEVRQRHFIQDLLGNIRQERAYYNCISAITDSRKSIQKFPSYHDLAFLYYALMHGQSTLGYFGSAEQTYVNPLRKIKENGNVNPKVLLLGFSSIYSLENLAAMLHLVGFKQSTIVAIDLKEDPQKAAKEYCKDTLFSSKIIYLKQDILANKLNPLLQNNSFDLIATHLFFTHFTYDFKKIVWDNIGKLLSPNGLFVDEEIVVEGNIDRQSYNNYYKTLKESCEFSTDYNIKLEISELMYQFGKDGPFNPYSDSSLIINDAEKEANLSLKANKLFTRNLLDSGGRPTTAWMYGLVAKK